MQRADTTAGGDLFLLPLCGTMEILPAAGGRFYNRPYGCGACEEVRVGRDAHIAPLKVRTRRHDPGIVPYAVDLNYRGETLQQSRRDEHCSSAFCGAAALRNVSHETFCRDSVENS